MTWKPLLLAALVLACLDANSLELLTLETRYDAGRYRVRLTALLDAAPNAIDKVLTDYSNYPRLDPRIRWGRIASRSSDDRLFVETMLHACVGIFCRDVRRIEQVEHREGELDAVVVPGESDVRAGWTRTRWRADGNGTYVEYETEFEPAFWIPAIVARKAALRAMSDATVTLFGNVEKEARGR